MMSPTLCVCLLHEKGRYRFGVLEHCYILKAPIFISAYLYPPGLGNCFLFKCHYIDITNKKTNLLFFPWNIFLSGSLLITKELALNLASGRPP